MALGDGVFSGYDRRRFLQQAAALGMAAPWLTTAKAAADTASAPTRKRTPVIDVTDLYHPAQDPGDNVDLIAAYGLPEIDLKAVIFDITGKYRRPYVDPKNHQYDDPNPTRDPGFIPVQQLNYLFDREVPCGCAPFTAMAHPEDTMAGTPKFQQAGIDLLLKILQESPEPVEILSFGSARPVAVAFNREPDLLRRKVSCVRLCAGGFPAGYLEWNVQLDVHAFVRLLRSDLPVVIYPCATEKDPWDLGEYNTAWSMPEFSIIRKVSPPLQRYLAYALTRSARSDFLRAVEDPVEEKLLEELAHRKHYVWESDVWMHAAGRKLVRRADGTHRILPGDAVREGDRIISNDLHPCRISVDDTGSFTMELTEEVSAFRIFRRPDPKAHQAALIEALPDLYASFRTAMS